MTKRERSALERELKAAAEAARVERLAARAAAAEAAAVDAEQPTPLPMAG